MPDGHGGAARARRGPGDRDHDHLWHRAGELVELLDADSG